ncbi:MAG: pyridoxamine 5'-phosphate oxidase family protein [Bacteroidales bacterium]|nr:pyridoxamine 5'-phosphate oxidase family protein [Bacteroidales bacterium]
MKKFEINQQEEIDEIVHSVDTCTLAMVDDGLPYCVPMNFGYEQGILYFHGAPFGRKIDVLNKNPEVCVSFYSDEVLNVRHKDVACSYSMKFKSVLFHGKVVFIDDNDEKERVLNIVMKKFSGRDDFKYSKPALDNVNVFYLKPEKITAFKRGY